MPKILEIHEFSTGIVVETNPDGSWFSRGFTGRYMNQTIEPIPPAIQEAIGNREFAIAEGASSDTPALIGREVGDDRENWSVVAVVTKGRDESRSFSAYRYFCTQGKGNLGKIIRFLANQDLKFDPFDRQEMGEPHLINDSPETTIPLNNFQDLLSDSPPVVVKSDRPCPPLILNQIAATIAGDTTAWAYNVQAVEAPRSFYVIKPSDEKAEEVIRRSLDSQVKVNKPIFGEQKIKTAITTLCKRNKVKAEYLETIENALGNPDINEQYWQVIFEGQGVKQAETQGIYSPDMIRLFTLQAAILPKTLPKFLNWMSKREGKKDDHYETALDFQTKIISKVSLEHVPNFASNITQGVESIIPLLLKQPKLLAAVVWLLKSPTKGLWSNVYYQETKKFIDNDLKLMPRHAGESHEQLDFELMGNEEWRKIWNDLTVVWRYPTRIHSMQKYEVWAELFDQLNAPNFAALFAQIAYREVPQPIFAKVHKFSFGTGFTYQVYGIRVYREVDFIENFLLELDKLGGVIVPLRLVAILLIISSVGSFLTSHFFFKSEVEKSVNKFVRENKEIKADFITALAQDNNSMILEVLKKDCYVNPDKCKLTITDKRKSNKEYQLVIALETDNFTQTKENIENLYEEFSSEPHNKTYEQITNLLGEILNEQSLQYGKAINQNIESEQKKWVEAIYQYQESNSSLSPDGIIDENTYNFLKAEIEGKL